MIFLALAVWACCFAGDKANSKFAPVARFVPPWNFPQLEVADNCTRLCGMQNALYLSVDYGCVGRDHAQLASGDGMAIEKVSFCPDKTVIKTWTVAEELEFEAVYLNLEELEQSELDVFYDLALEREMKLSVHRWSMLLQEEINIPQDRRRATYVEGSSNDWSCFGGNGGAWTEFGGGRPMYLICRHGRYINRFEFAFDLGIYGWGNSWLKGGGFGGSTISSTSLPDCITYINIRAGRYVDAIRFFGDYDYTPCHGGYGGEMYALFAPSGKCLGDIGMRTGALVDKICFKFNVSK